MALEPRVCDLEFKIGWKELVFRARITCPRNHEKRTYLVVQNLHKIEYCETDHGILF